MATIYAYTSNNITCTYTMTMARSGRNVTLTVSGTIKGNGSSSDSTSGAALYAQVRYGVSPANTSGTTTYVSSYGTLLDWASTTTVTGYTGTNSNCMIASNTTSNNLPPLNATGFPTGGRAFTIVFTTSNTAAVSLSNVALFIFKNKTATTAPSNGAYAFIGKKGSSLSGNQLRYYTQSLSAAAAKKVTITVNINGGVVTTGTDTTRYRAGSDGIVERSTDSGSTWSDFVQTMYEGDEFLNLYNVSTMTITRNGHHITGTQAYRAGSTSGTLINQDTTAATDTNACTIANLTGSSTLTADTSVVLYVNWIAWQLTVQYNANGGTITTGTGTTRYRVSSNLIQRSQDSGSTWATLALTSGSQDNWNLHNVTGASYDGGVKKTGYHVVSTQEFNTNAAGTGNTINMESGDTNAATIYRMNGNAYLTADKTISLYVKWVVDTYTISYNKGANGTGTNTTDTKTYGVALTLKGAIFTRTGYTQTGWSTTDGGAKVYDLSASYTTNAATTLYPYWTINTWTVGYNANGHGTAPASQTKTYNVALTLQPFISNVNGTTSTVTITGNNQNGDSWSGSNGSATWCPVYSQTYWNTNNSGTGTNYSSGGSYTANADTTLYAIWETTNTGTGYVLPTGTPVKNSTTTNTLTVSYNANGGSSTPSSQTSSKTVTYSFKGWFTAASGGTQRTTSSRVTAAETVYSQFNSTTGSQAAITLRAAITHANTTPATYTVTFNPNNGATTKTSQDAAVTRTWTFNGWHEGSASGTSHAASSSFTPSANVTMYAGWNTSDSTASVTLPTAAQCTRTGYTLLGFSTSSTATTATYAPGATYTPSATIILYAVWKANTYTHVYSGGEWKLAPVYIYWGGSWKEISTVIKVYNGTKWTEI